MNKHTPHEQHTLPAYVAPLADGWEISECVDADGTMTFWILSPEDSHDHGNASKMSAPHEQVGALPREWKRRLGLTCGAKTRSGASCKTVVRTYGLHCSQHAMPTVDDGRLF